MTAPETTQHTASAGIPPSVASPEPLTITLFGPMEVRVGGRLLPRLRSRKTLWLLALLVLRHGRPVEREWLAGTLWPEVDQSQAFANLRPIISELRHALGGEEEARLDSPNRHTLLLDLAGATVDVLAFDAAIADGTLPALERAAGLYRGPLLEGCAEEWVGQERGAREQGCLQALKKVADAALDAGDLQKAAGCYGRAVAISPLWDAARRGWMDALARSGDTNAALQVYREFAALLKNDPHAVPDAQTNALYQRLRDAARQQSAGTMKEKEIGGGGAPSQAAAGRLPDTATELVGREDECLEVAEALHRSRLVTLTGVGGIGKTRLAIQVARTLARDFADGVWFVALDALHDDTRIIGQIASDLGLREAPGRSLLHSVTDHLRDKRLLLVLDNCEHLIAGSAKIAASLLQECANLRIIATSREALGITGEVAWAVPSLTVPNLEHLPEGRAAARRVLLAYESVQLFVDRAQEARETFVLSVSDAPLVARICVQLEGIPLAIELAAARIRTMAVTEIAALLGEHHPMSLLTAGGGQTSQSRQQTLRTALNWSYDLLCVAERILLRRLSVFTGGWTLEAAEQVCAGGDDVRGEGGTDIAPEEVLDLLTSLVDKSLIVFQDGASDGGGRFRQLEMVRQYGAEALAQSGEADAVRARHRAWLVALAEEAEPHLTGAEQADWLRRLDAERDNLRATLAWEGAVDSEDDSCLRIAGALFRFWRVRGYISEGREHLRRILGRDGAGYPAARAKALNGLGALAHSQGDYGAARELHGESLALRRELGDRAGIADALNNLGDVAYSQGDYMSAQALYEESLSLRRALGDKEAMAWSLHGLGNIAHPQGRYDAARSLYRESLNLFRAVGDHQGAARTLCCLAYVALDLGDTSLARTRFDEALALFQELADRGGIAWSRSCLGYIAFEEGNYASAEALLEEGSRLFQELGDRRGVAWSRNSLGNVAHRQGRYEDAKALCEESLAIRRELGDTQGIAWSLFGLGGVRNAQGEPAAARSLIAESLVLFKGLGDRKGIVESLSGLADVMLAQGSARVAVRLWSIAEALRESIGAPASAYVRARHEEQVERARVALGEAGFAAAWEEGRALPWEQALEFMLLGLTAA